MLIFFLILTFTFFKLFTWYSVNMPTSSDLFKMLGLVYM